MLRTRGVNSAEDFDVEDEREPVLLQGASARSDQPDLEFLRSHPSSALPPSPFTPGKSPVNRPDAPTPTRLPPRFYDTMWSPDEQVSFDPEAAHHSVSQEHPSPASEYAIDSPTLSTISSPSTVLPRSGFSRSTSFADDSFSSAPRSRPQSRSATSHLPADPSQLSESYSFRPPHQHLVPPALSSADSSSASTRSSAYTNSGSALASVEYGNVHVASGEDDQPVGVGITSDDVVQLLGQESSSGVASSRATSDNARWSQSYSASTHSRSSSVANSRTNSLALSLNSKPSFDAVWRTLEEQDETSEDETDEDPSIDEIDEDDLDEDDEEQPTSAMVVAEEGRGVIVRGDGTPIVQLHAQPGTTHLLIGSASTPNAVPSFLANNLPNICDTLLALDVSANFLGALSPALGLCTNLEELNIASNPLRALPVFLCGLTSLRVLIADSTGISTLPQPFVALEKLHTLSVRRNKMHSLPSWLCILPSLETLLVDGNPFQGPWKALVDPLLTRATGSLMYPPSTPIHPPPSASIQSTTTGGEDTDTEDYSDVSPPDRDYAPPEDDTITPARASLGRAVTAPYPSEQQQPARPGGLTRNRTTPNRAYYDKGRSLHNPTIADFPEEPSPKVDDSGYFGEREVRRMKSLGERELRKMKSAGELRDVSPLISPDVAMPIRPTISQYSSSQSSSNLLTTPPSSPPTEPQLPPKRFASLGVTGSPSRMSPGRPRPQLSNSIWDTLPLDEETPAESSTSPPASHRKSLVKMRPMSPPKGSTGQDPQVERSSRKGDKDKDRNSRWGFLKKMSMGKMRSDTVSSRPSSSQGKPQVTPPAKHDFRPAPYAGSQGINTPPHINVRISTTGALDSFGPQASLSDLPSISRKPSSDALKDLPPVPSPSADHLLTPSSPGNPTSRASKRRSFLPIDISPIPIPSASSFFPGLTIADEEEDARATPSPRFTPAADSFDYVQRREDERAREAYTRALRSVMAYLRDMHDLGLAQTNMLSMYGSPTDTLNGNTRSRRPTMVDGNRSMSEHSMSSSGSAGGPDSSGQLRSKESRSGLRNSGDAMTNSMLTMDSIGSGGTEERKTKNDKIKRARIVREIVETERTYVKGLQELVDIYIKPACAPVNVLTGVGKETVLPSAERKVVFSGLESLFSFHKESFLPVLEAAAAPVMISGSLDEADPDGELSLNVARTVANSFVSHAAFMRMYSTYINNFDNSVQRIKYWVSDRNPPTPTPASSMSPASSTAQLVGLGMSMSAISAPSMVADSASSNGSAMTLSSSQKRRIKSYLKRCRMNPRHSQLNLEGYLLLPVQRIPRYRMLLEELYKCTTPAEFMSDPIDRALSEISSLATNMNEGKRDAESRRKLVLWQARIRGKFPSPLVQPHRRLIVDGSLSLTRVVRKASVAFEVIDSHGDASTVQVECLAPEMTPRALIGILCNDLLVLCRDPSGGQDPNSPVDLWAVLRMQTLPQPASIVHGNALRLVDNKAVLYFDAPSTSDALNWFRAINLHIPASKN